VTETVLINTFEVATDREQEFLELWRQANALLREARAYRSTRLHRALSPDAIIRYVNVAQLDSVATWRTVLGQPAFRAIAASMSEFSSRPASSRSL
jgi:heme-degrading monooxygenase HmoA